MIKNSLLSIGLMLLLFSASCSNEILPIPPVEPLPNEYQLAWQELEYYGFIHFNMNSTHTSGRAIAK